MDHLSMNSGTIIKQMMVFDLNGFGTKHIHRDGMRALKNSIKISSDNYTETLGKCYIINAPWVFSGVWKVIKPWLAPVTQRKIQIVNGNGFEQMVEDVCPSDLPVRASLSFCIYICVCVCVCVCVCNLSHPASA